MKISRFLHLIIVLHVSFVLISCGSETQDKEVDIDFTLDTTKTIITPNVNSSNVELHVKKVAQANATGGFSHPFNDEDFNGNLLVSVDVEDDEGLAAVALSFNESEQLKYLCDSVSDCNGSTFHKTETNINPVDFGVEHGPITIGLWVMDVEQNQMQVSTITINWQFRRIAGVELSRSNDGNEINLSWQENSDLIKYNIYLAADEKLTPDNYLSLTQGQALLAQNSNQHTLTNLIAQQQYFLLVTGIDGSGESAFSSRIRMDAFNGISNTPPQGVLDDLFQDEDTSIMGNLLDNDIDNENNTLTVTPRPLTRPTNGGVTLFNNGDFNYIPQTNFSGNDYFEYEIQDGQGGISSARANITIAPVNDAPQAVDDNYAISINQDLDIASPGVLINDFDIDSDNLSINTSPLIDVMNGVLLLNIDGSFSYSPNSDFVGLDHFEYQVYDDEGLSATGRVFISVGQVNSQPVAIDDSYSIAVNASLIADGDPIPGVLANDYDPDGDEIYLQSNLIDNVDNGTLTINIEGFFTYIPNTDFVGIDTFIYAIEDSIGTQAQATVSIHVENSNQAPNAVNDSVSVNEDELITIDVLSNDSDIDGDALEIVDWQVNNGTVSLNGQFLDYQANDNYFGDDNFSYTIYDGNGNTDTATVSITVLPVNDAPIALDDIASVMQGENIVINVLENDSDIENDSLSILSANVDIGSVSINSDNTLTFESGTNSGIATINYAISDGNGGSASASVTVTIMMSSNNIPVAMDDTTVVEVTQTVNINVLANDSDLDGDMLTVTSISAGTGSVNILSDNSIDYTAPASAGMDSFVYFINDGNGGTASATVTVTITPVSNTPPSAVDDVAEVDINQTININVLANDSDIDGDNLTVTSLSAGAGSVVIQSDNTIDYTATGVAGSDAFIYFISDGNGGTDSATVRITINNANLAPTANDDNYTVDQDTTLTADNSSIQGVLDNDTDPENDSLTVITSPITNVSNGTLSLFSDGRFTYTPNSGFFGMDSFEYQITDGSSTATAMVTISINQVNLAPTANDDNYTVDQDTTLTADNSSIQGVLDNDTDPENDSLTVITSPITNVSNGTLSLFSDGRFTYTPNSGFFGTDSFEYQITDGTSTATAMVTISINQANLSPTANDDNYTVDQDTTLTADNSSIQGVLDNDTDPENDSLTVITSPITNVSNGTLSLFSDGRFTYTPNSGFFGSDSFEYQITDGTSTATAMVTISINQANLAPIARPDDYQVRTNVNIDVDGVSFNLPTQNDSDPNSDPIQYNSLNYNVENGVLSINNDSSFLYTPNNGFSGVDSFVYSIDDGLGEVAQAIVTLNVSEIDWLGDNALPNIVMADYQGISFDGNRYFIVANQNILTSSDLSNWQNHYHDSSSPFMAVASGQASLSPNINSSIAVGKVNKAFSQQGEVNPGRWAERTTNTFISMVQVVFNQNEFIATGMQCVMYSNDGIDWQTKTPNTSVLFNSVERALGITVIVGNSGTIETSLDDNSWTVRTSNVSDNLHDVVSNLNNIFVAVGANGSLISSADGITWTTRNANTSNNINSITWGNNMFMAVGDNSTVITSPDGINWTLQGGIDSQSLNDVIYDGSLFVLVGDLANVFTSSDGVSYQPISTGSNIDSTAIAHSGSKLIRAGNGTNITSSTDGTSWSDVSTTSTFPINQVEYFNNAFIAVGDSGLILTSPSGDIWTTQSSPTSNNLNDVFWFSGLDTQGSPFSLYVIVGDFGAIITSQDGINWVVETTGLSDHFYGIDHDDDYFVAVGSNGKIIVRNNTAAPGATTWMNFFSNSSFGQLNDIIYNGSTNIIIGDNGIIVTGTAMGGSFSSINSGITANLNAIAFSGSNYITVGDNGVTFTSENGVTWLPASAGSAQHLNDVIFNSNNIFAVGDLGTFIMGEDKY